MKLTKTTKIDATADDVWALFAHRFEDADQWMAAVSRSYGLDSAERFEGATTAGRIVEGPPDGNGVKATERFVAYDEVAKTCSVRVDPFDTPRVFPLDHMSLDFSVVDDPDGGSTATWVFGATLKRWGYVMWPMLRIGMFKAWNQLCEDFQHYVETGTPHPRKVAAIKEAGSAIR